MKRFWMSATLVLLSSTALAAGAIVTHFVLPAEPANALASWHYGDVTNGGVSRITANRGDSAGGAGALEQWLPSHPSAAAKMEIFSEDVVPHHDHGLDATNGGFGFLANLRELSFEWYRDSSSTAWGHLTPAVRLIVHDPDVGWHGATYALVWEGVYNGYANQPGYSVTTDRWIHSNITYDKFWRVPLFDDGYWRPPEWCASNRSECYQYNNGVHDWGLGPNTIILGMSISAGPGWSGTYHGHIDLVTLDVDGGARKMWDFEPAAVTARVRGAGPVGHRLGRR